MPIVWGRKAQKEVKRNHETTANNWNFINSGNMGCSRIVGSRSNAVLQKLDMATRVSPPKKGMKPGPGSVNVPISTVLA